MKTATPAKRPAITVLLAFALGLGLGLPAAAENRAVVVTAGDTPGFQPEAVAQRFRQAGFATTVAASLGAAQLPRPFEALAAPDPASGARVVVMAGTFVSGGGEVWLLGADAQRPGLLGADRAGIGVSRVLSLMSDTQGPRILLLAEAPASGPAPGARLRRGVGPIAGLGAGTAGVSVIAGPSAAIARAASALTDPGASLAQVLIANPELRLVSGPAEGGSVTIARGQPPVAGQPGAPSGPGVLTLPAQPGEAEAWVRAAGQNNAAAYRGFLEAFPAGRYASVARDRLARMGEPVPDAPAGAGQPAPGQPAQPQPAPGVNRDHALSEIALNLSLGERSQIQQILTGAGFDTGGTDGQFGRGTREALRAWQGQQGLPQTGYVDAQTLRQLRNAAGLR